MLGHAMQARNEFASHVRIALNERVNHTADSTLAKLAFILTPRGFHWFQRQLGAVEQAKPLARPSETLRLARVQVNRQIEEMRHELSQVYFYFGLNTGTVGADLDHDLDGSGPSEPAVF
jgi:hypothetical protein